MGTDCRSRCCAFCIAMSRTRGVWTSSARMSNANAAIEAPLLCILHYHDKRRCRILCTHCYPPSSALFAIRSLLNNKYLRTIRRAGLIFWPLCCILLRNQPHQPRRSITIIPRICHLPSFTFVLGLACGRRYVIVLGSMRNGAGTMV